MSFRQRYEVGGTKCVPVQKGKLLAVRGLLEERLKPGRKVFDLEGFRVEALLEVQHPDAQVNNGKPLYLTYVLADHETPHHRIRAPWSPEPSPDSPHGLELFINFFKSTPSTGESPPNQPAGQQAE